MVTESDSLIALGCRNGGDSEILSASLLALNQSKCTVWSTVQVCHGKQLKRERRTRKVIAMDKLGGDIG